MQEHGLTDYADLAAKTAAVAASYNTISALRTEYAAALEEKKNAYREYRQARTEMRELLVIKANVDQLLHTPIPPENEHQRPEPSR